MDVKKMAEQKINNGRNEQIKLSRKLLKRVCPVATIGLLIYVLISAYKEANTEILILFVVITLIGIIIVVFFKSMIGSGKHNFTENNKLVYKLFNRNLKKRIITNYHKNRGPYDRS
jgi:hypothetical protein